MESTQTEVQRLQQQLNETNQKLQRSLVLTKELKIEKERLMVENYALIRQMAILKNRYEDIKKRTATVTQCASNLEKVVNAILPEAQTEHAIAQVLVQPQPIVPVPKPSVKVTPKPAVQVMPKPVSAVPAIVKQPTIKHVHFSPSQMLQIKQKEDVKEKILDMGTVTILDSVGDIVFKKPKLAAKVATESVSLVADAKIFKVPAITDAAPKIITPTKESVPKKVTSIEEPASKALIEEPVLKKVTPIEKSAPKKVEPVEEPAPKKVAPIEKSAPKKVEPVEEPAPKKEAPVKEPSLRKVTLIEKPTPVAMVPEKPSPVVMVPKEPSPVIKVESKKVLPTKADEAKTDPKPKPVDAIPAKIDSNENLVKNILKTRSNPVVLLNRANVDQFKAATKVILEKIEPLTTPKVRKSKRKADSDVSDDSVKQARRTRSMAKSDKDDSMTLRPMPSPIQRQSSKYGKKEAEGHPKVFTSTPNSAVRKEVKLVGNLGNRSQSDQTKPVTVKLEPENSARTTIYRLGTKKIAKRRQTMVL